MYAELEGMPDRGRDFADSVRHLLQWEDAWAAWKQGGCQPGPLERPPAAVPEAAADADISE